MNIGTTSCERFKKSKKLEIVKNIKKELKRNYGIDLLRIFAMINIIILHINLFCDQLSLDFRNPKFKVFWRLETMAYWAVDGFGMISGIVGYKHYKFSNLMIIWVQSSFYSFGISLYFHLFCHKMNQKKLYLSFLPLLSNINWYVNAYFCMYLFLPFINYGIMNLNRNTYKGIILFFFLFCSLYHMITTILVKQTNYHFLNSGYSALWLIILYIIGGYFGKYVLTQQMFSLKYCIFFIFIYLGSSYFSFEFYFNSIQKKSKINKDLFISYLSPTMLMQTISLIMLFSKLNIKNKWIIKIISFFTPLTFNITLIHLKLFRDGSLMKRKLDKYVKNLKSDLLFFKIYGLGIVVYLFCGMIDFLRLLLFNLLRIKKICIFIENKFPLLISKINI